MADESIAAEVVPAEPRLAMRAAKALQQRGFHVLHIGGSISVQAPRRIWEDVFGVAFSPRTKMVQPELGRHVSYPQADSQTVRVPTDLAELVAGIAFAEPPDLH